MPRWYTVSKFLDMLERDAPSIPSAPVRQRAPAPLGVGRAGALSPTKERQLPRWKQDEGRETIGLKAASIAAALSRISEQDLADSQIRDRYRKLRAAQEAIRRAEETNRTKVKPAGSDKRQYNPTGKEFAVTRSGTNARIGLRLGGLVKSYFKQELSVLPCIERVTRREVMFAKRKAGKGYKKKHRVTWSTGIPC